MRARQPFLCLFTGPHGRYIDVHNFSVVVLIASDWGVVAHVPYLQALIRAYNDCTTKARRIHLIWQLDALGKLAPERASGVGTDGGSRGRPRSKPVEPGIARRHHRGWLRMLAASSTSSSQANEARFSTPQSTTSTHSEQARSIALVGGQCATRVWLTGTLCSAMK